MLVRSTVGSIFDTSIEENTFSIVTGIDAFCQMGDPALLFSKLFRWVSTDGVVLVCDYFALDV